MMLAEEFASNVNWTLIFMGITALCAVLMWLDARKQRSTVIANQPLNVEVVKELHEEFANKDEFDNLKTHITKRHGEIFGRIDQVERIARTELAGEILRINNDRAKTMDKLNDQFTFIRENISAINRELQIRNQS